MMEELWSRSAGGVAIVGGLLTVVVSVPATWYGVTPTDSYLFSPDPFSPLWINRSVVPVLAVIASLGLLVGLIGLIRRDWPVAGRARRWGGVLSVIALGLITASVPTLVSLGGEAGTDVLATLVFLLIGLLGAVLLVPGFLSLGYGYAHTRRPRLGYAFGGMIVAAPVIGYLSPESLGSLLGSLPIAVTWLILGVDLWRDSNPLS